MREACPLGLAPTSSTTAALVAGDALAISLIELRGFTKEEFAKYHPSGSLGRRLLLKVEDIMRPVGKFAKVQIGTTIHNAVQEMIQFKSGLCVVVDESDSLCGVFTHGDFARAYNDQIDIGRDKVDKYMSPNPITILCAKYALEAKEVFKQHKIDDLVVLNEFGQIVGIIDSQDTNNICLLYTSPSPRDRG